MPNEAVTIDATTGQIVNTSPSTKFNGAGQLLTSIGATAISSATSLPFLLGPSAHNYINAGDSLTQGPSGLATLAPFAFTAVEQGLGLGQAPSALFYNMGFSGNTTAQISANYAKSGVTTTITTTSGSATATVASASGISNGMCIGSANTQPNTTLTISGTTVTLSRVATGTGAVTCSIATPPTGGFGELYPGGLANGWLNFRGTPHQLSFAVSGIASTYMLWAGANDYIENTGLAVTVTATTTNGSPNVTITGGTFSGIVNGCVITSSNLPSAQPLYVISGAGTANLVLSGNATGTGSASTVAHFPTTAFATWQTTFAALIATAKADGNTVYVVTLPPAGNSGAGAQGDTVGNAFRLQWNAYIVANTAAANYVIDVTTVLPAYGSIVGSPYYSNDSLHFSPQGHALLGRFFTQQIFAQQYTSSLSWNPFAVNALPDSWLSTNIPLKNQQNVFNPASGAITATASITVTSTTGTLASALSGVQTGMYVSGYSGASNCYPPGTTVTISGTSMTTSSASNATNASATLYFSYLPFPAETVFKQVVRIGPNNDVAAGSAGFAVFTSQADLFSPGNLWVDTTGATRWYVISPTAAAGSMLIGNAAGTVGLTLASTGTVTVTGGLTAGGTNTFAGTNTFSGTTAFTGGNNSVYAQNSSVSGWTFINARDSSSTIKTQFGHANASASTFYGTGTPGNQLFLFANTLYFSSTGGAATPFASLDQSGNFSILGNLTLSTVGKGLQLKGGSNARTGSGTLVGGTLAVANTSITANSKVFVTDTGGGVLGNIGALYVASKTASTGFTVTSTNVLDTSAFDYFIIEVN